MNANDLAGRAELYIHIYPIGYKFRESARGRENCATACVKGNIRRELLISQLIQTRRREIAKETRRHAPRYISDRAATAICSQRGDEIVRGIFLQSYDFFFLDVGEMGYLLINDGWIKFLSWYRRIIIIK